MSRPACFRLLRALLLVAFLGLAAGACTDPLGPEYEQGQHTTFGLMVPGSGAVAH